jgi:threonine/homoserine/homoserine lactone efflux protein
MLLRKRVDDFAGTDSSQSLAAIFRQGLITNILNPKVALFFLAFLPQFVSPERGSVAWQLAGLGLYFGFSGTLVNLAVALAVGLAGDLLRAGRARLYIERFSGAVIIALGLRVGLSRTA